MKPGSKAGDAMNIAMKRLEVEVLEARLTFIRVLAERFDAFAQDRCDGLDTIAEMCGCQAEDFKSLGMDDEAELLLYLTDTLRSGLYENDDADESGVLNDEICVFSKLEFVKSIMEKLIGRLKEETPVMLQ
jgi:hypothetical protein